MCSAILRIACPRHFRQSREHANERGASLEPELPGPDPHAPSLLGRAGLRDPAAIRHGDGGGDIPPRDRAALAWARTMARRLCPTVPATDRRALRREPEPPWTLLPISGGAEAEPGRSPAALSREPDRDRHRSAEARHPLRR